MENIEVTTKTFENVRGNFVVGAILKYKHNFICEILASVCLYILNRRIGEYVV